LIIGLLASLALCNQRMLNQETAETIKAAADWESYNWNENPFKDYSESQLKGLFGTTLKWTDQNMKLKIDDDDHTGANNLPESFDSRVQWKECVNEVRNQQHCGSCWAFSASTALANRFCIATGDKVKPTLSPQDLVSCDKSDNGCEGGMLENAWKQLENVGIVQDSQFPYVSGDGKNVPVCPYKDDDCTIKRFKVKKGTSRELDCPVDIKKSIMNGGPVQTGFMVYEDFMHYKSGIYTHKEGKELGGHAVMIIGWGKENGQEYWIAENSWGPTWGEEGYFRIALGECNFDANAYAGVPDVHSGTCDNKFLF